MQLPDSPETVARKQRERDIAANQALIRKVVEACSSAVNGANSSPDTVLVEPIRKGGYDGFGNPVNYSRRELRAVLDDVNEIIRPSGWRLHVRWWGLVMRALKNERCDLPIAATASASDATAPETGG